MVHLVGADTGLMSNVASIGIMVVITLAEIAVIHWLRTDAERDGRTSPRPPRT